MDEGWELFGAEEDARAMRVKNKELPSCIKADEPELVDGMSDTASSSSDSSSRSTCHEEELRQKLTQSKPVFDCEGPLYHHKKSRVLHRPAARPKVLMCGHRVNDSYSFLQDGASFKRPRCNLCFKGEVLTNVDQLVEAFGKDRKAR